MSKGKFHEFEENPILVFIPTQKVIQTMTIATFLCVRTQKIFLTYIFFLTFHQLWVIWEKSVKGELSVLFSFATRAFFREMVNYSLFPLFPDFFCQFFFFFFFFLSSFNPSKNLLWLDLRWFAGLKWISNERIYQYHERLAIITTFAPFIPTPPPLILEVSQV